MSQDPPEENTIFNEWGGDEVNEESEHDVQEIIIAAILGLQNHSLPPLEPLAPSPPPEPPLSPIAASPTGASPVAQVSGRIRRREEVIVPTESYKLFRGTQGKRIVRRRRPQYSYLRLKSGDEFHFTEEDGKRILLNESLEPNRLIRNIISKIPSRISERLDYLGKFKSGEDDEETDEDSDSKEPEEDNNENAKKVTQRYLGDLANDVLTAYIKEWRLRFIFRRVLICWRLYKLNKTCQKEIDPITLSEPEKEVYLYDWTNRRKFIFDAKSLATLIESKLTYQEYGFPVPMYPRNPKNNVEFSYKQLISLYYQLKAHGELRWGFTTLRECNFNKNKWHMYHRSALTMNAIRVGITLLDTYDSRDLFMDFIFAKMDEIGFRYNNSIYNAYEKAVVQVPNHWYLEKLKSIAMSHFEAEHFGQNRTRGINAACQRIFSKHNTFMRELRSKNIIP